MQKKILLQVSIAIAFFACIAAAIVLLFSDGKGDAQASDSPPTALKSEGASYAPGLAAVPMDAVIVMCNRSLRSALSLLCDGSAIYRNLFCGTGKKRISPFLDSLDVRHFDGASCVISMHYSRDLEPLVVLSNCRKNRERLLDLALSCKLEAARGADSNSVIVSTSQSLLAASSRHLQVGSSILDDDRFTSAVSQVSGRDAIFFVGKYAPKIAGLFLDKSHADVGRFFASYADVLAFIPEELKDGYGLHVLNACGNNPAYRVGALGNARSSAAAEVLPQETVFAVSVATGGIGSYIEKYKTFLDANSRLSGYSDSAEKWARGLDIKEVTKAEILVEGKFAQILCVKTGPKASADILLRDTGVASLKEYRTSIVPYAYAGYASNQFGPLFSIPEESYFFYRGGWIVIGDNKTLTELLLEDQPEYLAASVSKSGIKLSESPVVFYDISANADRLDEVFDKDLLARSIRRSLSGSASMVMALSSSEIAVKRTALATGKSKIDLSAVTVPGGPFVVTNSGTGKKNTLAQNGDGSLTLKDENGKTLWNKSFPGRICGAIGETDYYNNGKIQFVVATGDQLYMLDRLGRVVKDFPVSLGKDVLLGPSIYDFSGAHGYSAVVLHTDNTIGLYDIHGRIRQGWKGIAPPEQIVSLPELIVDSGGRKLWKVTTVSRVYTYPFNGGDKPISKEKRK